MSHPNRATLCILFSGAVSTPGQEWLAGMLNTPLDSLEIRLAFCESTHLFYHAVGALCPDGAAPACDNLPDGIQRFHWTGTTGARIYAWQTEAPLPRERMLRLLFHDVYLETEYVVWLDGGTELNDGWRQVLAGAMESGSDYLGTPVWRDYLSTELDKIQVQPWYMGVPFDRREGRAGVTFMSSGLVAARCDRLREADFPVVRTFDRDQLRSGSDMILGEIARQLGWTQAALDKQKST